MKLDSRVADGFTGVWSAPISRASRAAFPWAPFLLYPDFATSLTLRGIARDKKPVARESKRTIAKVSAPVPLVMGQVLRFYVVALRC